MLALTLLLGLQFLLNASNVLVSVQMLEWMLSLSSDEMRLIVTRVPVN